MGGKQLPESLLKRFWGKVEKTDGCWLWTASTSNGYGQLSSKRGKSPYKAYRLSWEIHYGDIPDGLEVCHECDNPRCVRPDHLFLGTHLENMIDAHKKGRLKMYKHGNGEDNNAATLTMNEVRDMRRDYANGMTIDALQEKYHHTNIVRIVRNMCYFDPDYKPINGNAKPRPYRKVLSKEYIEGILSSNLPSRKLAKIYGVSKPVILSVKKGKY